MPRVFLITGSNRGIGHAIGQHVLNSGDYLAATARNIDSLKFENTTADNYLPLKLDVSVTSDIHAALSAALDRFKRIDVVINNAAHGLISPAETVSEEQIRAIFDVNFFSAVTATREALRIMREQSPQGGVIVNVSSIAALFPMPCMSLYNASKAALEIFTEAVSQEVKPEWNIRFTLVEVGHCATDAMKYSMVYGDKEVGAYSDVDPRALVKSWDGLGVSPIAVGRAIYDVTGSKNIQMRSFITPDAPDIVKMRLQTLRDQVESEETMKLANSTAN
jgi:NAD(P)-dependent dehydrogenase (short-subunit alcohol dehydrogenase family)